MPRIDDVTVLNSQGCMIFDDWIVSSVNLPFNQEKAIQVMRDVVNPVLLLEGGGDIHPRLYGQENTWSHSAEYRDFHEIKFYEMAREFNIPIIGICRGHQLVAALNGGTLYQDIYRETGKHHSGGVVTCSGMLRDWYGDEFRVNSLHHQAVNRVPDNAVVEAVAKDGIIEALRYDEERIYTVQWHPEIMGDEELLMHILFDFFKLKTPSYDLVGV